MTAYNRGRSTSTILPTYLYQLLILYNNQTKGINLFSLTNLNQTGDNSTPSPPPHTHTDTPKSAPGHYEVINTCLVLWSRSNTKKYVEVNML